MNNPKINNNKYKHVADFAKQVEEHTKIFQNGVTDHHGFTTSIEKLKKDMYILDIFMDSNADNYVLGASRCLLEMSALNAIKYNDFKCFAESMTQLRPYYFDLPDLEMLPCFQININKNISDPNLQNQDSCITTQQFLLGLELMRLLVENNIIEFHATLELVINFFNYANCAFITFPIQLEQAMMEGTYGKVFRLRNECPSKEFMSLMEVLINSVREELASIIQVAYGPIPVESAAELLLLNSPNDIFNITTASNWVIKDGLIIFNNMTSTIKKDVPIYEMVQKMIGYSQELERII